MVADCSLSFSFGKGQVLYLARLAKQENRDSSGIDRTFLCSFIEGIWRAVRSHNPNEHLATILVWLIAPFGAKNSVTQ